jgi:hypothetical protein
MECPAFTADGWNCGAFQCQGKPPQTYSGRGRELVHVEISQDSYYAGKANYHKLGSIFTIMGGLAKT